MGVWILIKISLFFSLFALPSVALFFLGFIGPLGGFGIILSIPAAFPVGGALCASMFCITKIFRREPDDIWFDFRRKFSENFKQAMAPGILCVLFVFAQAFLWWDLILSEANIIWILTGLLSLLIFLTITPYIFLQMTYIVLKTSQILKNSLILSFANFSRSFLGAVCGGAIWIIFALTLPDSLSLTPVLAAFGCSLSMTLTLLWIWPIVDKQFDIAVILKKRSDEEK